MTLAFLGGRPEEEVPALTDTALGAVEGLAAPALKPVAVVSVPPRRPRLFALDLADREERAGAVQAAVSEALSAAGLFSPEKRPFLPHLTLARVRGAGPRRRGGGAPIEPPELELPSRPLTFSHVTLYRSHLSQQGARYEALARRGLRA
jgi:RNA 2',3'-cyclic 3'-phosphodiesterase